MATASKVQLDVKHRPAWAVDTLKEGSAKKISELLQKNHEDHHIFFNKMGLHNHIVHHLLAIYALGATPEEIQFAYDNNNNYQRDILPVEQERVKGMHDPKVFLSLLEPRGSENGPAYHNFLEFFREEIQAKGWQNVVNEYLFKGDERANTMLVRTYAGFLHPLIHIGYGIEFDQPAIVAEGLAQAACHGDWIGQFLIPAEQAAQKNGNPSKSIISLLEDCRQDEKLCKSPKWSDGNKVRDGVIARAGDEMIKYASQYVVKPEQLEEKTAEMIDFCVYFTGSAQHPPNVPKIDFYYMHDLNSSIFYTTFLSQSWLSPEAKCRLLEWKVREDLAMYVSRLSPDLLPNEISNYTPRHPNRATWADLFARINKIPDDGHSSKLIRALKNGEERTKTLKEKRLMKEDMWLKLANLATDSVEDLPNGQNLWVRSAGFEEAWKDVTLREGARL